MKERVRKNTEWLLVRSRISDFALSEKNALKTLKKKNKKKFESHDRRQSDEMKIASAKNLKGMPNQFSKERISSRNVDSFYTTSSYSLPSKI